MMSLFGLIYDIMVEQMSIMKNSTFSSSGHLNKHIKFFHRDFRIKMRLSQIKLGFKMKNFDTAI